MLELGRLARNVADDDWREKYLRLIEHTNTTRDDYATVLLQFVGEGVVPIELEELLRVNGDCSR